jgi:hypothetical protein
VTLAGSHYSRHKSACETLPQSGAMGVGCPGVGDKAWGGRPVRQEQAQGILIAALGVLAARFGCRDAA